MDYIGLAKALGTWVSVIVQIGGFLIALFLLWRSNKKDFKHLNQTLCGFKFNIEKELTRHESEINDIHDKIDKQILPELSDMKSDIKKNCQALLDIKESCKERHYGVNFSVPVQRQ